MNSSGEILAMAVFEAVENNILTQQRSIVKCKCAGNTSDHIARRMKALALNI